MYSRDLGISSSRPPISADYLREKYIAKTATQKSIIRKEPFSVKEEPKKEVAKKIQGTDFTSNLENDDLLLLSILAFLLFSKSDRENFDIILAAALLFVEFY